MRVLLCLALVGVLRPAAAAADQLPKWVMLHLDESKD